MKKSILLFLILLVQNLAVQNLTAQNLSIQKIEPPNWWAGMKLNKIQLMVYGSSLNNISAAFSEEKIKVDKIHKIENPSYAFIDITIPNELPAGNYTLTIKKGNEKVDYNFPIYKREKEKRHQGFSQSDVIYLLMPDRFANGDPSNDKVDGYLDRMDTIKFQGRAGGDLQGIINKLDYIKELGITAVWCTPLVENNTFRSYHGYSATDFYNIDPRFGSNELYKKFVDEAHKHGIKVILDHVANHFSDNHPWMKNLPVKDWINGTKENHLGANHHKMIFTDIHADSVTIKHVEQGWFVNDMVDLNQENQFVANYIIQNTIWWVEFSGLDGIREDTHPYNNQKFISRWAKTVLNEFPTLNIVGEVWTGESDFLAAYQNDTFLKKGFDTNLPSLTDFPLRDALISFVTGERGLYEIFNIIAKDFLYTDPDQLLTFVDNHDLPRIMLFANGNVEKAKMAYGILFTTRGIPCLFYGSEIGAVGGRDHGQLRMPFPGGFTGDNRDAFTRAGRTESENEIYDYIAKLIKLRRNYKALSSGKLIHYPPVKSFYFYLRESENEKFLIIANDSHEDQYFDLAAVAHRLMGAKQLINMMNDEKTDITESGKIKISKNTIAILKVE
ncbi:MAG: alpha-amylase family glycosyl hydrolase [Bacteroidota bacterium]